MTKDELIAVFGTLDAIAEVFAPFNDGKPLTKQAISQWDDVPPLREYQLREAVPDIDKRIALREARA